MTKPAFEIHFRRLAESEGDYSYIGGADTLEGARARREVSGDLVVYGETHKIVIDPKWLFPWEQEDPSCYAQQAIRREHGRTK